MPEDRTHMETALGVWAVLAGALLAGAIGALFATVPAWGWVALTAYVLLSLLALLSFTDLASRTFLAGTLRHRTYTQIYTTLTRRLLMPLWATVCDEPGNPKQMERERIPVATLFRHALTWRLYDKALLIAVAYPILLPVLQWLVTGEAAVIGSFEFLPAAPFWWDRATILGALTISIVGVVTETIAAGSRHRFLKWAADRRLIGLVSIAFASAVAVAGAVTVAAALAILLAATFAVAGAVRFASAGAATVLLVAGGGAAFGVPRAFVGPLAVVVAVDWLNRRGRPRMARWVVTIALSVAVFGFVTLFDFNAIPEDDRSLFLFLAVLPLLNALFDTLSYAVTLTLLRRGLRSRLPLLWGLLDLALACLLFLALGATLIVVIHGLNTLAGVPLVDLPALLAAIHERPGDYLWLYAMLFSTILPTALHGLLSLLGVQGLWPRAWRRPVAAWVEGATASPLTYLRAGLALGAIWTLPLLALGGILWLLWVAGGGGVTWVLERYFDLLLWIATVPVGAV